ncbi:hypothetical protein [Streptomyces sp. NPDC052107]|uniref:hypothetical protein n=1 Tax=Streptomyces sp. NPDC052107 TaxID=3155632 RepID=UPI003448EFC1
MAPGPWAADVVVEHGMDDLLLQPAQGTSGAADDSDGPVFVDASGRRSRRFRRLGIAVGLACVAYPVVILATLLSGNSGAPWLPVPDRDAGTSAVRVDTSPRPSGSAEPSRSRSGSAGPARPVSGAFGPGTPARGRTTSSAAATALPAPSGSAVTRGASTTPEPSTSSVKPTSGRTTDAPDPEPSTPAGSSPDPTTSGDGVTPGPSPSTANDGSEAGGSVDPVPVGAGSTGRLSSPENVR